ncbi:hypothetical protein BJ138DRAFT_1072891 [Hygrophoropsis aurantiaca]|uniref:Uncharacterized protein n=1 Tax=Hygrophoropsis aurantiaca TaxID=72124 RepID=A0ACB7ZWL8_9AGAM|nr:hypothetical protein BJ138DRAFT_1072891 [Hygrophoropsis aurantiaca]
MAAMLSRAAKRQPHLLAIMLARPSISCRHLHVSSAVHASAKQRQAVEDDLFSLKETNEAPSVNSSTKPLGTTIDGQGTEKREARFYNLVEYITERTGRKRAIKAGQVRQSAWLQLFQLSSTPQQLELVSDLFPRWRDSGKQFQPEHAEAFVRRCEELKCPPLALKVFGDHPKYGFRLASFFAAQHLLHSLHYKYPLQDTMAAAALFGVYKHPPVSSNKTTCSMLLAACLKHDSPNARTVSKALIPELQAAITDAERVQIPQERHVRAQYAEKPKIWLIASLRRIERKLRAKKQDVSWLKDYLEDKYGRAFGSYNVQ